MFRYAYGHSDIQLKERFDSKRGIEGMFSADNFDFYSNFWNIGETIGLSWGDPECIIKKRKNWMYIYDKHQWIFKKKHFEETIIDFAKYLKNLYSK